MGRDRETLDAIVLERQGNLDSKLTNHAQPIATLQREVAVLQTRIDGLETRVKERTETVRWWVVLAISVVVAVLGWAVGYLTSR